MDICFRSRRTGDMCYADRGYTAILAALVQGRVGRSQADVVGGTPDARRALVQDVRVDLRRGHVPVTEQLLHGADVAAVLEAVGGERVAQGVTRGSLG